jgi:hypothetical protein
MSLIAVNLKNQIISDLAGITNANTALTILGNTLSTYIKTNAVISFSWNGIQPPSIVDPVIQTTGRITVLTFILTPSSATTQVAAFTTLKSQLIAGLTVAQYNITAAGFVTTPALMSTSPSLSNLTFNVSGTTQDDAMLQFATGIINWIQAQAPTQKILGAHGVFTAPTGIGGTVVSIS